ncbi:unnamed protein product [Penicillium camemberti]|uniref:Str. FM013 n=1 Tax=Penicillium camemberti (strain FM 013) TaxID=1429867 RepID=A0A0G4PTS2_PENC3|nr:unnamed protein product [Penicillium camemberti]
MYGVPRCRTALKFNNPPGHTAKHSAPSPPTPPTPIIKPRKSQHSPQIQKNNPKITSRSTIPSPIGPLDPWRCVLKRLQSSQPICSDTEPQKPTTQRLSSRSSRII